ncbi:MAG: STAS domain-containing protein [Rubrivivax sp.]|jgi:anti-anti-sigma factor|nr:STAS domain-containing protein [Rubrivivax sp.]
MELEVIGDDTGLTHVRPVGRMDVAGTETIAVRFSAAVAATGRSALIDFSGVDFIASMGIRLLITTAKAQRLKGHRMVIYGAQPAVQDVFDQSALDQVIDIVATEADARARLAG